jgi:DNA mismatch repair protein MutH
MKLGANTTSPKVDQELVRQAKQTAELAVSELRNMVRTAHPIVRLAGISGALAVALGAYGAHGIDKFLQLFIHIII